MTLYTNEYLRGLVREDRVHRSIYTDPQIFELEMEKIFSRVWIYVGHESQIPNPGDFHCTSVARQRVLGLHEGATENTDAVEAFAHRPG